MRIGIDLGGTKIEGIILDSHGTELGRLRVPTPRGDYKGTIESIADIVTHLEKDGTGASTIGIGIPGAISPATNLVKNANSECLIGQPLQDDLEMLLGRAVRIANDANCFAVSEAVDGAAADYDAVFGVIIGTGCGGGWVVDGQVRTGRTAIAGEWGHNPLPWSRSDEHPGPQCYCGQRGCLETFISGTGLERDYAAQTGNKHSAKEIADLEKQGDEDAGAVFARYENRMARALAVVINIVDPDAIVLGGGLSNVQRIYENVPAMLGDYVFSDEVDTPILKPKHGDSSGVRGAAWLWGNRPSSP